MAHGLLVKNNNGSDLFQEGEIPLQYWGKKTYYMSNNGLYALFNLPSSHRISVYGIVTSGASTTSFQLEASGGKWYAKHFSAYGDGTLELYVFVPSTLLPREDWGLEVYNSSSDLIFNGTRPMLQVESIHNAWVSKASFNVDSHSSPINSSKKLAIPFDVMWVKSYQYGSQGFILYHYFITSAASGSGSNHGVRKAGLTIIGGGVNYGAVYDRNYGAIDANYYSTFTSLANYS